MSKRFGTASRQISEASLCNVKDAPWATPSSCITMGFWDDNTDPIVMERNWRTMQIFAKQRGWKMSSTVGDTSQGSYDIVYFSNSTSLEQTFFYSDVWMRYVTKFGLLSNMPTTSSNIIVNGDSFFATVGGASYIPMGDFGFQYSKRAPDVATFPDIQNGLMDAYLAYQQANVTGGDYSTATFPQIKINMANVPGAPENSGFTTTDYWVYGGPLIIWVSIFASQLALSSHISEDRRKKLRIGMVMMGLNTGAYQISWFIYHSFLSFLYSLIALGIGHACKFPFFVQANPAVTFLLYWVTSIAAIGFTMMTTALVHHPSGHMAMMIVAFLIGLVLSVFTSSPLFFPVFWANNTMKKIWSVNYCFQFGNIMQNINTKIYDIDTSGSKRDSMADTPGTPGTPGAPGPEALPHFYWKDIYTHNVVPGTYEPFLVILPSVSDSLLWILLCAILALVVSIYLEIVFPREIGSPQSFVFFVQPSYWGFDTRSDLNVETVEHRANKMSDVAADLDPDILAEFNDVMRRTSEADPTLALAVTKISKTFKKGMRASEQDTRAVDQVTLGADMGTVLGIVGHNGAGKTTLMSMLCGVVSLSTGDARVFDHSVSQNMTSIHNIMGVCPQEDVLWPELTPHEHLKLFAMLKRIPRKDHSRVIANSLNEVGLYEVRHRIANKLSGGMKRRLSVAIALIGRVQILMLDEPTAGLDPRNRLEIWNIIERVKQNRVVILTTHSMQEAAALSDKIAVMAVGRLRAVGTPQHLVQRFGKGHQISVTCKVSKVEEFKAIMAENLPDAQLEVDTGARLTYSLASSKSRQLPEFCEFMESQHSQSMSSVAAVPEQDGLVEDWGISQTTLEQVFLKLTHGGGNTEGLNSATSMQLNIAEVGSARVLGFVAIQPASTLDEVRDLMIENPAFPTNFTFILNGAPVTKQQERSSSAYRALPTVELQVKDDTVVSMDANVASSSAPANDQLVNTLKARIQTLESQLQDQSLLVQQVQALQTKVDELQAELKALREPTEEIL